MWYCGKCGAVYEVVQLYEDLKQVPDDNPDYGTHPQCPCGYTFHKDKWRLSNTITWGEPGTATRQAVAKLWNTVSYLKVRVSTVDLETDHDGGRFETMFFVQEMEPGDPGDHPWAWAKRRYQHKEDAQSAHDAVVKLMEATPLEKLAGLHRLWGV